MRKAIVTLCLFILAAGPCFAATECDVWLGTWDVLYEDGSAYVWVIDEIVTGTSKNIPCQAKGASTPVAGGASFPFQIITVTFLPGFVYTESSQLGEDMGKHVLEINAAGDAFVSGTLFTDYGIKSGTKRVSGPRCGGLQPSFAAAGATALEVIISGTETHFNDSSTVNFGCKEISVVSTSVKSPTQILATITVSGDAGDTECPVTITTGEEKIQCSLEVRGTGDPERVIWEFQAGSIVSSSPAVDNGYVYFGSADKKVYCLSAQDGSKLWEFETGNAVFSCPAVSDGRVYVGSNDTRVYCLDAQSGSKVWEFKTGDAVQSSPALVNGYVYVGSYDNKVYCLNAQDGSKVWEFETANDVYSTPAVLNGSVYVGGVDYKMYCLDAKTGSTVWTFATDGDIPPSPAVYKGKIYFGSKDSYFYCLDAKTGNKLWDFKTGDIVFSSPAITTRGFVYFASLDNNVYCLEAESGTKAWEFATSGPVQSSPAATSDYVYIGSNDSNIYCLDAKYGTKVWNFKTGGSVYSSPAVVDGRVYIGSFDNKLYCLKAPDEEQESWTMFRRNIARIGSPQEQTCLAASLLGASDPRLTAARHFRDKVLAGSSMGRNLITAYYEYGKQCIPFCRQHPMAGTIIRSVLAATLPALELVMR
jgi:outer membrane protein assembly factor BamB